MTPKFLILCNVCTDSMGSAGAHETLDILGEMLDSFDHPEQSSTTAAPSKAKQSCMLLSEMLESFDQGLKSQWLLKMVVYTCYKMNI